MLRVIARRLGRLHVTPAPLSRSLAPRPIGLAAYSTDRDQSGDLENFFVGHADSSPPPLRQEETTSYERPVQRYRNEQYQGGGHQGDRYQSDRHQNDRQLGGNRPDGSNLTSASFLRKPVAKAKIEIDQSYRERDRAPAIDRSRAAPPPQSAYDSPPHQPQNPASNPLPSPGSIKISPPLVRPSPYVNDTAPPSTEDTAEVTVSEKAELTEASSSGSSLMNDMDEFFLGLDKDERPPASASDEHFAQPYQVEAPKTSAPWKIASYVAPEESGVAMVRRFLEEHKFLSSQQMWQMGTEGLKPQIQPTHEVQPDGRLRMKRVATMREGRRPWVPPMEPRYPDHPFRSMSFFKATMLESLQDQGLLHKAAIHVPLETQEEHEAAIAKAEKVNRQQERRAIWLRLADPPMMKAPATTKEVWGWKIGPAAPDSTKHAPGTQITNGEDSTSEGSEASEVSSTSEDSSKAAHDPNDLIGPVVYPSAEKWLYAERLEYAYHQSKLLEARATAERQTIRRAKYREERDQMKSEREADRASGRYEEIQRERQRSYAIESIERYAHSTNQDVSDWYQELETGPMDEQPRYRPKHLNRGGAIPRGRSPRAGMRPMGFPIN